MLGSWRSNRKEGGACLGFQSRGGERKEGFRWDDEVPWVNWTPWVSAIEDIPHDSASNPIPGVAYVVLGSNCGFPAHITGPSRPALGRSMAWLPFALGLRWGIHTIIRANLAVRGVIVGDQVGFWEMQCFHKHLSFDMRRILPITLGTS